MQDLLANYGQDSPSSDEESSTHEKVVTQDSIAEVGQKRKLEVSEEKKYEAPPKKKLKLPSIFDEEKKPDPENDPSKHGGKIRQFAHVEGNYPSHVFIKVSLPQLAELTTEIIDLARTELGSSVSVVPLENNDWHISLSRPFAMREHHIKLFVETLQHAIETCPVQSFETQLTEREIYVNDEKTRSFVGLNVTGPGCSQVVRLIKVVDSVMKSFAFPVFYEDPKPHVTIAWMLGDVTQNQTFPITPLDEELCATCLVDVVQCRIGKFNHFFKLK